MPASQASHRRRHSTTERNRRGAGEYRSESRLGGCARPVRTNRAGGREGARQTEPCPAREPRTMGHRTAGHARVADSRGRRGAPAARARRGYRRRRTGAGLRLRCAAPGDGARRLGAHVDAREPVQGHSRFPPHHVSSFVDGVRVRPRGCNPRIASPLRPRRGESCWNPSPTARRASASPATTRGCCAQTHAPGRHQYLVASDILEADVVINLPKLKTHKKAGHYLRAQKSHRHQRQQGVSAASPHRRLDERRRLLSRRQPGQARARIRLRPAEHRRSSAAGRVWRASATQLYRSWPVLRATARGRGLLVGQRHDLANLPRSQPRPSLRPRRRDARTINPARACVHVVDAIVAGQGDGPLAPQPLPLGLLRRQQCGGRGLGWRAAAGLRSFAHPTRSPCVRSLPVAAHILHRR